MAYTTINKSSDFFNTNLYTGNSTATSHAVGFQPDFTWLKVRNASGANYLFDSVRLSTNYIQSNSNAVQGTDAQTLKSFDANGYTVGTSNSVNTNGEKMVAWNWKAGTAVSGNTSGSGTAKTYTGSVNTTSGFSIIKYTGNGTNGMTIPHHLGAVPKMIMVKRLDGSGSWNWQVYNKFSGATKYLMLNQNSTEATSSSRWYNVEPTSSVFTLGNDSDVNVNDATFVAYCFTDVQGYQKIGNYTGNNPAGGSKTQFVYTGFTPKFVMFKERSGAGNWNIYDLNRNYSLTENNYNIRAARLAWNLDSAESSFTDDHGIDILSNGFIIRDNSNDLYTVNANNETYMYYAVAEAPLVGTNNVPCTAR